jgi:hypothetical protein
MKIKDKKFMMEIQYLVKINDKRLCLKKIKILKIYIKITNN